MTNEWKKKFKGSWRGGAWIYTHSSLKRAIVKNHNGVTFNGMKFSSVSSAQEFALSSSMYNYLGDNND